MIGFLRGRVAAKHPPVLLLDVNGVGYEVEAPMSTFYGLPAVGAEVQLHTHLVVREDAHVLFGFGTERERSLFRELITDLGRRPAHRARHPLRCERRRIPPLRRSAGCGVAHPDSRASGARPRSG